MILVTGAAGKTGQAVIRALVAEGSPVCALVRRSEQVPIVEELGAQETVVGDMRVPATLRQAAMGAWAVYHICPNMHPDELVIGQAAVNAARTAGVEHFVYHSVLHPQTEAMPHHWQKLRVEEYLFESDLPFTILQPAAYMQNVLAYWDAIVERGVYAVPYAVDTVLSMVDVEDVATVAAEVLTQPGHMGATYELAGPDALAQTEVARVLSKALGRVIRAEKMPLDEWEQRAQVAGMGDYQVEALIKMFRYYERYGFWGNSNVLGWLLRRPPTSFAAFLKRAVKERSSE
jgi:uncharacterized protein YbjT (DUF2867 family)